MDLPYTKQHTSTFLRRLGADFSRVTPTRRKKVMASYQKHGFSGWIRTLKAKKKGKFRPLLVAGAARADMVDAYQVLLKILLLPVPARNFSLFGEIERGILQKVDFATIFRENGNGSKQAVERVRCTVRSGLPWHVRGARQGT